MSRTKEGIKNRKRKLEMVVVQESRYFTMTAKNNVAYK